MGWLLARAPALQDPTMNQRHLRAAAFPKRSDGRAERGEVRES